MSFVTNFNNDIFISYAHIDNQSLTEDQKGWISFFHHSLEIRLQEILGAEPDIWRDGKLKGNDYISDTIVKQFPQIAVMISILSPRYINSKWCLRELQEFSRATEQSGGVRIDEKARVFKVVKSPVPREEQPQELRDLLGYEFFEKDKHKDRPHEFRPELGKEELRKFCAKLEDLAYDIRDLLIFLKKDSNQSEEKDPEPSKPAIYLAETTFDLKDKYDKIKRELKRRGYLILPDESLPLNAPEFEKKVSEDLQRCKLAVHLIGKNYGIVPDGEKRSIVELQYELTAQRSLDAECARLVWLPVDLQTEDERQQKFIDSLKQGVNSHGDVDLLQTSLEDFKTYILDKLSQKSKNEKMAAADKSNDFKRIYLICDQRDIDKTDPIEDYLFDQGFEVKLPGFEGDESQVREAHKENLLLCDGAIVYYGNASDSWLNIKMADLQKISGYGRKTPIKAKAVYKALPETKQKKRFKTREALIIDNYADFSPESLGSFLQQIGNGHGGQS